MTVVFGIAMIIHVRHGERIGADLCTRGYTDQCRFVQGETKDIINCVSKSSSGFLSRCLAAEIYHAQTVVVK